MASPSLSSVCLGRASLSPGCRLRLSVDEGGGDLYECTAEVVSLDLGKADPQLKCRDVRNARDGTLEPGHQLFLQSEIVKLEVVQRAAEGEEAKDNINAPLPSPQPERGGGPRDRQPPPPRSLAKHRPTGDNPHLRKLYPLTMEEILSQIQIAPPPEMPPADGGRARLMPEVEQSVVHQEGDPFRNRTVPEFIEVRKYLWKDKDSPPPLQCYPEKLYYVESTRGPEYEEAMAHLEEQDVVGLSLEGQVPGRDGELSLVCVTTRSRAIIFDAVAAGADELFGGGEGRGLRWLLEAGSTVKVMHDCRLASDMLANRFGVRLANVYDTLAAHVLFVTWSLYAGYMPKYAHSLGNLARAYFGISGSSLFFPHYRLSQLREDMAIWMERPLPENLVIGAARNAAYLLDLQRATRECMISPFIRATHCFLSSVRDVRPWKGILLVNRPPTVVTSSERRLDGPGSGERAPRPPAGCG